jgi:hypothetical protein
MTSYSKKISRDLTDYQDFEINFLRIINHANNKLQRLI